MSYVCMYTRFFTHTRASHGVTWLYTHTRNAHSYIFIVWLASLLSLIDLQISSASSDLKQEFCPAETAAHAYINCPSLFSGKDDAKEK